MSHNLASTEESHSELGAAQELFANVWEQLRADRIELGFGSANTTSSKAYKWRNYLFQMIIKIWRNFLQCPVDIATSIFMSLLLVALFVAESSGSVASASIISDTIANVASSNCSVLLPPIRNSRYNSMEDASSYAQRCYDAPLGSDGCNDFYNQSIGYTERANDTCPFLGNVCAGGRSSAVTFDTGYVHARTAGLNAAEDFYFRRSTTCSPLMSDGHRINITIYEYNGQMMVDYNAYNCVHVGRPNLRAGDGTIWGNRNPVPCHAALDPAFSPTDAIELSPVDFVHIAASELLYSEYRNDPVFPATVRDWQTDGDHYKGAGLWRSNSTQAQYLGCVDLRQVCEGNTTNCQYLAAKQSPFRSQSPVDADMAYALLAVAVSTSSIGEAVSWHPSLEIRSHCISTHCGHLPAEQWKVEARRWFQASLARIQVELLNTARGTTNTPSAYYGIPEPYREMCRMAKFKSVGWRNVSVWGLSGLLCIAAGISLASVKTEDGDLWLTVGGKDLRGICLWSLCAAWQVLQKLPCKCIKIRPKVVGE